MSYCDGIHPRGHAPWHSACYSVDGDVILDDLLLFGEEVLTQGLVGTDSVGEPFKEIGEGVTGNFLRAATTGVVKAVRRRRTPAS